MNIIIEECLYTKNVKGDIYKIPVGVICVQKTPIDDELYLPISGAIAAECADEFLYSDRRCLEENKVAQLVDQQTPDDNGPLSLYRFAKLLEGSELAARRSWAVDSRIPVVGNVLTVGTDSDSFYVSSTTLDLGLSSVDNYKFTWASRFDDNNTFDYSSLVGESCWVDERFVGFVIAYCSTNRCLIVDPWAWMLSSQSNWRLADAETIGRWQDLNRPSWVLSENFTVPEDGIPLELFSRENMIGFQEITESEFRAHDLGYDHNLDRVVNSQKPEQKEALWSVLNPQNQEEAA